jgi:hypothetical protein
MSRARLGLVLLALASCERPPVFPGADPRQNAKTSRIEGSVIALTVARGDICLFLFDANDLPPPEGGGRPLSFALLTREEVFGSALDDPGNRGPFTAPFAFSLVPPGRYFVRGFVDVNGDFAPWYSITEEPNAGDIGGAAADFLTQDQKVVEIGADLQPAKGVSVLFSDIIGVEFPKDRPAFEVSPSSLTLTGAANLTLNAKGFDDDLVIEPNPVFLASLVDGDGDGMPDDADGDGVPDFWPKVWMRKMVDGDLLHDEPIALQVSLDSTLEADLVDSQGRVKTTPMPTGQLPLVIGPGAFDISDPANPVPLSAVPPGRYSIRVIQCPEPQACQTWRVPNELAPSMAGRLGFSADESQGFSVEVP